jgi:hypothetical protein
MMAAGGNDPERFLQFIKAGEAGVKDRLVRRRPRPALVLRKAV